MDHVLTQTEEARWLAALAGLLHDIGKLAQRAGWMKGKHTEVGAEFVRQVVPEHWRGELYAAAGHHERPLAGRLNRVVALADRLAAAEREESERAGAKQLVAALGRMALEGRRPSDQVWPLEPLALHEDVLMPREPVGETAETAGYRALWDGFLAEVRALPDDDLPTYVVGLYYALQRAAWCVPGAHDRATPDVSLFDHSRATAALAACFVDLDEGQLDRLLPQPQGDDALALLVGGDVSGVQDFIYTVTARGAAKGLRGRSFYLQALTEGVARYVLRRLGLPPTNLIYAGGGHFYLLAPVGAAETLATIRAEISRKLLAHHGGDLYVALGWAPVTADEFDRARFSERWGDVGKAVSEAKGKRFAELESAALAAQVFGPTGAGGDEDGECQVCHYEGPDVAAREDSDDSASRRICDLCASLEALGTDLREADFLLLGEVPFAERRRGGYADALRSFGMVIGLTDREGRAVLKLPEETERATLLAMHDLPEGGTARATAEAARRIARACGCPVAPGTRYVVNVTPRVTAEDMRGPAWDAYLKSLDRDQTPPRVGDVKEFGLMQQQAEGTKRLGVLRMDVDDLGDILRWGMREAGTLSRVAAVSFALSLFFEGWVGERCRQVNAAGPDKVYAIYSGGDDLFIVGAWDVLPGLAATIRQDLARFAAGNPAIHISGGLTLHGGKYPLYQAAADAEDALETAKDTERPQEPAHRKDALNFLGLTIPWEAYGELDATRAHLQQLVDGGVGRSLLRTLLTLYAGYVDGVAKRGKPYWGPLMWYAAYRLRRMAERYKEHRGAIIEIAEQLDYGRFQSIETLGPAARWAELLIRKEQA